jgi:hypothetical protein
LIFSIEYVNPFDVMIPAGSTESIRLYVWAPRSEVVFIQAVFDAHEGLGRIRTERHDNDRSLLLFLCTPDQKESVLSFLRHISEEVSQPLEIV